MHALAAPLAMLLAFAGIAPAFAEAAPMPDCSAPESRQFDFWIGQWSVTADGKPAGDSRIESILEGCSVQENWTGASGVRGRSLNVYNRDLKRWEQYWVDTTGSRLFLHGGLRDGAMVLEGVGDLADEKTGVKRRDRVTWTPGADGSVRQLWESSVDDGATWKVEFDGLYVRKLVVDKVD